MVRPQPRDHDVANDPGGFGGVGDGPLLLNDEGGVVLDAGDQRRARPDDPGEQFVVGVAAIEDIEPAGLKRVGQGGAFGTGRGGQGRIDGNTLEHVKVQVELDPTMVGVLPERPGHPREPGEDRAVDGGKPLERLGLAAHRQRHGLGRQFLDDRPEPLGVEDPRRLGERPQRGAFDAQRLPGFLPARGLLQGAEALQGGVTEVHQQERDVLIVEELPIAGVVAFRADIVQSRDRLEDRLDQPLPLKRAGRRHNSPIAFRSSLCHSDSSGRTARSWRKSRAEQIWTGGLGGVVVA